MRLQKKYLDSVDLTQDFDKLAKSFYHFKRHYCQKKSFSQALSKFMKQEPAMIEPFIEYGYTRIVLELRLRDGVNLLML